MNITSLQKELKLNSDECLEVLSCHPKQIISDTLDVPVWRINYVYYTQRGNLKHANKFIFKNEDDWDVIDPIFNSYIKNFNEQHPERKLSNVKILDASFLGKAIIELT